MSLLPFALFLVCCYASQITQSQCRVQAGAAADATVRSVLQPADGTQLPSLGSVGPGTVTPCCPLASSQTVLCQVLAFEAFDPLQLPAVAGCAGVVDTGQQPQWLWDEEACKVYSTIQLICSLLI